MKNTYRITLKRLAEDYGYDNVEDFLSEYCNDSVLPALCIDGCEVEPDGCCEHGCSSPLIASGLI